MKRKIISIGKTALAVTLPSKWYKTLGVKKGDELNCEYEENKLVISSGPAINKAISAEINISGYTKRGIHTAIAAYYKKGFDEIRVRFSNGDELEFILHEVTKYYIGFIIAEQSEKLVIFKRIAKEDEVEFENILRRAFFLTLNMADGIFEFLLKKETSNLRMLLNLEMTNNQLTSFCERLLVKGIKGENGSFYYVVVWNLEKICDNYRDMINHILKSKPKISQKDLETIRLINQFMRKTFDFFYDFSIRKMDTLKREEETIQIEDVADRELSHILKSMLVRCIDFRTTMAAIRIS